MQEVDDPAVIDDDIEKQLLSTSSAAVNDGGGGGSSGKRTMRKVILAIWSAHVFHQISAAVSRVNVSSSSKSSSIPADHQHQQAIREDMEDVAINIGDADQTVPLIQTLDNSLPSGKQIRKVINVHHFIQALKAHAASVATAHVRRDSSSAPKEKPEAAEASDSLAVSSKHHIIGQTAKHCQIEKISKIVRQRDFLTLQQFGGLVGVIDALGTDLDKGISDEEALDRHKELSICLTPTRTFLHFVWKEVKSTTVLLLSLAATLLIIFGTIEEGLQYGWTDGVVLLVCIILYVLISSMHKYWDERKAQKKFQKQQSEEVSVRDCCVKRGSETKNVSESELVYGDILFSKTGCQIPVEGLFVDGEDLELDGFESHIANKQKPFLSYGERVINGEAWMVVTSTNMMIRRATYDLNMRFRLETYLDKLNTYIHLTLIIFSIFIVLVSFLRFTLGKIDDENSNTPESVDKPTGIRIFSNTFAKIIKESKYTTKVLTKLVGVSLVGLTGGVNFVVSLALVYRNKKTLSAKVTEQVSHSILKMAAVTTLICTDTYEELNGDDDMEVQKVVIGVEFISEIRTLSPNVVEALCNGIGTSKENAILHGGIYKLGLNSEKLIQRQQIKEDEEMILHMNGPVNKIMSKCTHYCNIQGEKVFMNDTIRKDFHQTNVDMKCEHKLMTVAVACKHTDAQTQDATEDWVLVALLGLKNKNKEATKAEVKACRECGIEVVIVSSKKLPGLKDIALQYGITTDPPSLVLTGEDFRKYTDKERFENVGKIRVLGEALSSDKLLLVETLRGKGGVVAFLGQITNDTPALIGADIGIAIGNQSSKKAIESSDIIILDENFPQISSMVDSGKCFYYNIQSFIQPVLILTISGALLSLIQTAAWGDASFTIFQSLWANSAVLFLGGFALLTKEPTDKPVSLVPFACDKSLISAHMIRNILLQVLYQVTGLVIIQINGIGTACSSQDMKTMLFTLFMTCQFFNLFNARELQKINFFKCIHRHKWFWVGTTIFVVSQATFVAVQYTLGFGSKLNLKMWAICVLLGMPSWLVDLLGKCIYLLIIKIFVNRF